MRRQGGSVSVSVSKEGDADRDQCSDEGPRGREEKRDRQKTYERSIHRNKWTARWDVLSISFRQGAKQSSRAAHRLSYDGHTRARNLVGRDPSRAPRRSGRSLRPRLIAGLVRAAPPRMFRLGRELEE